MAPIGSETHTWSTGIKENEDENEAHAAVWQPGDLALQEKGVTRVAVSHLLSHLKHRNMQKCAERSVSGFAVTHLEVQSDGEEDQGRRHSHVSSKQQDFFPHSLNDHELQHQKTFTAVNHRGELRLHVRIVRA